MIEPKSVAEALRAHPVTVEEVEKLVAKLRAAGARVINRRGEDMTEADLQAVVNRLNEQANAKAGE
jgi:hypothetical protein